MIMINFIRRVVLWRSVSTALDVTFSLIEAERDIKNKEKDVLIRVSV